MKHTLNLLIVVSFLFFSCTNENPISNNNINTTKDEWDRYKITLHITYKEDGITEATKALYTYDKEGREIGYKYFYNGVLIAENTDYSYNGNECTYLSKSYMDGKLHSTRKVKLVYYEKWNSSKLLSMVFYGEDGKTEDIKTINVYDKEGKEISCKSYLQGTLSSEMTNYIYSGNECTYIVKNYNYENGDLLNQYKCKISYYKKWNRSKLNSFIQYVEDGIKETYKAVYNYDSLGREVGFKSYYNGVITAEMTDYKYNGKECVYIYKTYVDGKEYNTTKNKIIYY